MSILKHLMLVPVRKLLIGLLLCIPATSFALSPPIVVEPENEGSSFRTDTFIPDFLGPGFVTLGQGQTFDFTFEVLPGEDGLHQVQVRHASNNSISILINGSPITPDLALSTRTLGFWFDNEAYVTLPAGTHVVSFGGPVFLDTFRISRTPPDADRFLTYPTSVNEIFFGGSEENSIAYYNTIDPNGERATLSGFLEKNGFTSGGVTVYDRSNPVAIEIQEQINSTDFSHAVYQNIADLDLGRNMFVLKFNNGDVASYVQNFATPDNALIGRNILATVAMEYRADTRLTTFYAYAGNGNRVTKVDLDGRGQKFVPTLCAACHGGKPKDDIDGVYQNGGNIGSKWIAWDLDNFEYSSQLSQEDQEDQFRSMNQAVLCTTPSASNAELVRGWYGADATSNCSVPLPDVPFNGDFVPDGWNDTPAHRELYLDVVRPSCRSCHAQRGTYGDNTLLELNIELEFSTFADFEAHKDLIEEHVFDQATMPSALVTYEAFWRSRGSDVDQPEILDRVLFGGTAHVNPPESIYSGEAKEIYGERRQPGRPIAQAAETEVVTAGVQGRLNALPSDFAASHSWSVTGDDPLPGLPSNEPILTVDPTDEHQVTLSVTNFQGTFSDSTTFNISTDDEQRPSSVLFTTDILDLLQSSSAGLSCTSCHQPGGRANTVFHLSESRDFTGGLTAEQFAYTQALTRVDCRDPENSLLLRRPTNPSHFGGALFNEGDRRWTLLRRWIAEGAPFDEDRSFTEPGSDCGVVISDPEYRPAEQANDTGIGADYPRIIVVENTGDNSTAWVEFSDNTKQFINNSCRQQLVNNEFFDVIPLSAGAVNSIPDATSSLSCDAIAALPREPINSVPTPVQPGLDLEIREFAIVPDNTSFGTLRLKPGMLAMAHTGGRLFMVEQHEGKIWEFTDGGEINEPWFNVHQAFIDQTGVGISGANLFHGGLRSMAFHPEFATNGKFYTSQMRDRPDNREGLTYISDSAGLNIFTDSTLSEWTVDSEGNLISHREVFRIGYPAEDHLMKQIMFNPTATPGSPDFGLLYIAHGDGTPADSFGNGQNDDALGKILRINPLANGDRPYSIPASNPFTNDDSWETDEVFAMGFRNPHHIAFAQDGTLISVDVGRANVEEVNVITAGSNHGWPDREGIFTHLKEDGGGGFLTGIGPLPTNDASLGFTYPAAQYGHTGSYGTPFTGHGIAGGFVVENGSALDGQYLYGDFVSFGDVYHSSLQDLQSAVTQGSPDFLSQATTRRARVVFDHDNNPSTEAQVFDTMLDVINNSPRYFSHSGSRRADLRFGQGPGGEIYILNKRNNTIYLVTNTVVEGEGTRPPVNAEVDPTIAPVFPDSLRHVVYSQTEAELFWDRASDNGFVQGYEIIRNGELLGVFDSLSFFEGNLDPTIIYTYAVTAVDTDGNRSATLTTTLSPGGLEIPEEIDSPAADGDVDPTIAPVFPDSLRHVVYSQTEAELFWERASDNGFVQGYEIVRNGVLLEVRDALSFFEGNLDPAIIYTYEVTAIDTDGNRSATLRTILSPGGLEIPVDLDTSPADGEVDPTIAPVFPDSLRHVVYSQTEAELFWERASDNGFVQGYEIVRNGELLEVRDGLSFFEGNLDPAVIYTYEVTAIDTDGNRSETFRTTLSPGGLEIPEEQNTPSADGEVDPNIAPVFPNSLRHVVYSETEAELFWERASDNGFVQGYEIVRNGEVLEFRDGLSFFEGNLDPAIIYTYEVTAIDTDGNRSESFTTLVSTGGLDVVTDINQPTGGDGALDFSANLRHQAYSPTSAELFWNRANSDALIQGYEIVRNGESLGIRDALSLFEGDLDSAVVYTYAVTAVDIDGNRSETASLTFSTTGGLVSDHTPPIETGTVNASGPVFPANLRHQVYSPTSAELFWDRATDDGLIQGYEIIRNNESLGLRDSLSLFEGSLDPSVTYTYVVTAIDTDSNRSQPATITFSTSGNESSAGSGSNEVVGSNAPAAPSGLVAQVFSATAAELTWNRSGVIGLIYEVRRDGTVLVQTDGTSFFESSLDGGTTYNYQVVTIDTLGNRSISADVSLTTLPGIQ